MPLPLDRTSPRPSPRKVLTPAAVGIACLAALVVLVNVCLLASVKMDGPSGPSGGWADVLVVAAAGPLFNGILLVIALGCAPLIKYLSGARPVWRYVVASVALPAAAYAADYVLITGRFVY